VCLFYAKISIAMARPTKYSQELLKKAEEYVNACQESGEIPYIEELALDLQINDDTIVEWAKKYDEFSATVDKLKLLQRLGLKKGALTKVYQAGISIFLLKCNHGMDDKRVLDINATGFSLSALHEEANRTIAEWEREDAEKAKALMDTNS